jgi:hypothetical protein
MGLADPAVVVAERAFWFGGGHRLMLLRQAPNLFRGGFCAATGIGAVARAADKNYRDAIRRAIPWITRALMTSSGSGRGKPVAMIGI